MSKKMIAGVSLLVLTGLVLGWWWWNTANRNRQAQTNSLAGTVVAERRDLSEKIDATGTVVTAQNGDIHPAYEATVQQINHRAGERVKKGDLLMVLDSSSLKEQWAAAEADVNKAKINLDQAQKELEQLNALFSAQGATVNEVEDARKQAALYQEELKLARFNLDQLREQPDGANQIAADHRKLWIRAPFDGAISWVSVKPGDKVATGTLLLSLVPNGALEVEVSVDESEISRVKPGQKASIVLNDAAETELTGVVTRVGKTGSTESDVVVFPVTIQVDQASDKLRPGMSADVTVQATETGNVLAIPANAVVERGGRTLVRLWDAAGPKWVPVELGVRSGSYVEVLSGLNEGDRILTGQTKPGDTSSGAKAPGAPANGSANKSANRPPAMLFGPMGGRR